jgi:hypothetical protein
MIDCTNQNPSLSEENPKFYHLHLVIEQLIKPVPHVVSNYTPLRAEMSLILPE